MVGQRAVIKRIVEGLAEFDIHIDEYAVEMTWGYARAETPLGVMFFYSDREGKLSRDDITSSIVAGLQARKSRCETLIAAIDKVLANVENVSV